MTNERSKAKAAQRQWAIDMYNQGAKTAQICEAIGISQPTLYRYIKSAQNPDFTPRKPHLINETGEANPNRSRSSLIQWSNRQTAEQKALKQIKEPKAINTLQLLSKLNISLGKDNLGSYLYRANDDRKVYLTDQEFNALIKRPFATIKALASRINAGLSNG